MVSHNSFEGDPFKLMEQNIGELVSVTVTQVTDHGALCQLKDNGVKGMVTRTHMRDMQCAVGDEIVAVVLYTDFRASCLELSVDPELVKAVRHLKKNKFTQVRVRPRQTLCASVSSVNVS